MSLSASDGERVVQVVVEHGPDRPLDYRCPIGITPPPGSLVRVPLRRQEALGIVVSAEPSEVPADRLRSLLGELGPPLRDPQEVVGLIRFLRERHLCTWPQAASVLFPGALGFTPEPARYEIAAGVSEEQIAQLGRRAPRQAAALREVGRRPGPLAAAIVRPLLARGLVAVHQPKAPSPPLAGRGPEPTAEQAAALREIRANPGGVFLLHGITGSGKTEIYFRLIEDALAERRGALLLVPEIALTAQLVALIARRFGDRAAVLHSAVGEAARKKALRRLREGIADVAVGPRSAVFAPLDLGMIIVDEQHEGSYQQEDAPRYHAQEVALLRAARAGATLVLGSATPDLVTYEQACRGEIRLIELHLRATGQTLPKVAIADLRRTPGRLVSPELRSVVTESLDAGEQAILLLNRRGMHPSMVCTACGEVPHCPDCAMPLALHEGGEGVCHVCGHRERAPALCPKCGGRLRLLGTGTQRAAELARDAWPGARVLRLDRDAVRRMGSADAVYRAFRDGEADILVGTQMVAKGFDFPRVTAVGVLVADIGLYQPDYRAAERTFQLLTQVAGRAGRAERPGRVVIQTFDPEHPSVRFAAHHDFRGFAEQELAERRRAGYPPFGQLLLIGYSGSDENAVEQMARARAQEFRQRAPAQVRVLGPAPAPIPRVQGRYRWQVLLVAPLREELRRLYAETPPASDVPRETPIFDPRQFR